MSSAAKGRGLKLAIVGADGTVGAQLVELIEARRFPYAELKLFAASDSPARSSESGDREYSIHALRDPAELAEFDVALLALPKSSAAEILRARPAPVLIDLSDVGRALAQAPLAAPGITPRAAIANLAASGVVAIPHPAAHALATILAAIGPTAEPAAAIVILGASSAGRDAIASLLEQSAELMNARLNLDENETQLAFNLFLHKEMPQIAEQIASQVAALLQKSPRLVVQVEQAPTLHGIAIAVCLFGAAAPSTRDKLRTAPGILFVEEAEPRFRGVVDAVGQEGIMVRLIEQPAGITLWCTFDNARLAALCALWVAENLPAAGGSTLA